jgi:zinc finger SWIM domain-containing protein 3
MIVPEVGMSFESGENAYEMYNTYAGKVGFSIRKSDTKRRVDKTMSSKLIVCSKQGHGDTGSSHGTTRTGCHAHILFSINIEGIWTVQQVELSS